MNMAENGSQQLEHSSLRMSIIRGLKIDIFDQTKSKIHFRADKFNSFSGILKTSTALLNVFHSFNGIHDDYHQHQAVDICICTS